MPPRASSSAAAALLVGCTFALEAPREEPRDAADGASGSAGSSAGGAGLAGEAGRGGTTSEDASSGGVSGDAGDGAAGVGGSAGSSGVAGSRGCTASCGAVGCGTCPERALAVGRGYSIETTEVTADEYAAWLALSPSGHAGVRCSGDTDHLPRCAWPPARGEGAVPVRCVDHCDALAYCAWSGRRLCRARDGSEILDARMAISPAASEWADACTDGGRVTGPWGVLGWQGGVCQDSSRGDDGPRASLSTNFCQGGLVGIFDLVGNVREWIDACDASGCFAVGGSWASERPTCATVVNLPAPTSDLETGFRCCAN